MQKAVEDIFKVLKEKSYQARKISFKNKDEIKTL
jgi:transposase